MLFWVMFHVFSYLDHRIAERFSKRFRYFTTRLLQNSIQFNHFVQALQWKLEFHHECSYTNITIHWLTWGVWAVWQVGCGVRCVPPWVTVVFVAMVMMGCQRVAAATRESSTSPGWAQRPACHIQHWHWSVHVKWTLNIFLSWSEVWKTLKRQKSFFSFFWYSYLIVAEQSSLNCFVLYPKYYIFDSQGWIPMRPSDDSGKLRPIGFLKRTNQTLLSVQVQLCLLVLVLMLTLCAIQILWSRYFWILNKKAKATGANRSSLESLHLFESK